MDNRRDCQLIEDNTICIRICMSKVLNKHCSPARVRICSCDAGEENQILELKLQGTGRLGPPVPDAGCGCSASHNPIVIGAGQRGITRWLVSPLSRIVESLYTLVGRMPGASTGSRIVSDLRAGVERLKLADHGPTQRLPCFQTNGRARLT